MNNKPKFKYPDLADVLDLLECGTTNFDVTASKDNKPDDEKIYTFDTHPFYSQLGDYSDLEISESDIY